MNKAGICTAGKQPVTRGIGYTRIEAEAGGAARLAIPTYNAGLIDKGPNARANTARRRVARG